VRRDGAFICTAVVVVSAAVNVVHTASHAGQHVMSLPSWQLAFTAVVIYAAPVVAAVLHPGVRLDLDHRDAKERHEGRPGGNPLPARPLP
jgi:Na+/H+-dicarboxylate symporter